MKDAEAVKIYYAMLEATPGKATEMGAELWCASTRHLNYNDAWAALGVLLQTNTFISAADLNGEVRRMRAARCAHARAYLPSNNELTPLEQKAEYRAYWRHVANGGEVPAIDQSQYPRREIRALTKGINE